MNAQLSAWEHKDVLYRQAIDQLQRLIKQANTAGIDATAASLATSTVDGKPSVRIITVAGISADGILLFAHRQSGKAQQMQQNPRAALCLHWPTISREIIIEGEVDVITDAEADRIWSHLPREVGLAHWVSDQMRASEGNHKLKEQLQAAKQNFNFERIPRPPDWHGFEIHPDRIEFWETGWGRLRSRTLYQCDSRGTWIQEILNP